MFMTNQELLKSHNKSTENTSRNRLKPHRTNRGVTTDLLPHKTIKHKIYTT